MTPNLREIKWLMKFHLTINTSAQESKNRPHCTAAVMGSRGYCREQDLPCIKSKAFPWERVLPAHLGHQE